ncbi:MAG: hypothetical protein ACRDWE_07935 [Acidimicrobiales bacterium]
MAQHQRDGSVTDDVAAIPRRNVRVLRGEDELAAASARAAVGARRLHERLEARAARDAWMAEHHGQALAWLGFVRGSSEERAPLVVAASAGRRRSWPAA